MSERNEEQVSIVMPMYNVEEFLGRAIGSIQSQSFQDWHLYAVDDCSKNHTKR